MVALKGVSNGKLCTGRSLLDQEMCDPSVSLVKAIEASFGSGQSDRLIGLRENHVF
jgi:hypothetical protein